MRSDIIKLGIDKLPQRALLKGMGYINEEIANPLIGVIGSYNEISPGHHHINSIVQAVKDGVRLAGGTPIEVNTISVCDGLALGHSGVNFALASRELIADGIETIVGSHSFDAIVLAPNCEKVIAGMMMGAARVNVPAIMVCGGAASPGTLRGNRTDLASVFAGAEAIKRGTTAPGAAAELEDAACPGCGACAGMPNAHVMAVAAEVLGMTLPGNATYPAQHAGLIRMAKQAGMKIMELLSRNLKPANILTEAAFANALAVDASLGGSPSMLLHLRAIAHERGLTLSPQLINQIYQRTPVLLKLRPEGEWQVEDLHAAGGIPALLATLTRLGIVDEKAMTVTGKKLLQNTVNTASNNRLFSEAGSERAPMACISGNLAPDGAVARWVNPPPSSSFTGPARVFDGEKDALEALKVGKIRAGDAVVIRYEGPRGGPGMQELASPLSPFHTHPVCSQIVLITDGRFSGWYKGLSVQHVSPEAAAGGLLALLRDGDMITLDIANQTIDAKLDPQEIATRMRNWTPPELKVKSGYLAKYARLVSSAASGAVTR
ncbi:MAG: dihydroxy-acid dehydratase [Negativicutes bacterium]|nr:dihydroxy-acid dehydratase [Negativicutes bacterium]